MKSLSIWTKAKLTGSKMGLVFTAVSLVGLVASACASAEATAPTDQSGGSTRSPVPGYSDSKQDKPDTTIPVIRAITQDESEKAALAYLKASKTFAFDGMADTVKLVNTTALKGTYRWQVVYEFDSAHAGYGDRSGVMVAEVITHHSATIITEMGVATSGVIDGKWDIGTESQLQK